MPLILPRHSFTKEQDNWASTADTIISGTVVAASGSTHTKGSWVELIAATEFEVFGITLTITNDSTAATVVRNLYDIGVGGSGSEVEIIRNYRSTGSTSITALIGGVCSIFLPIHIPKGARVSARKQSSIASKTSTINIVLHGGPNHSPWKSFDFAETIGTDTATSGGTTHAFGGAGSPSTWTNIGSTLDKNYGAMFPMVSSGTDDTMNSRLGYLEMGISSTLIGRRWFITSVTEYVGQLSPPIPLYGHFNTGEQMMIRGQMSAGADTNYDVSLLGFY